MQREAKRDNNAAFWVSEERIKKKKNSRHIPASCVWSDKDTSNGVGGKTLITCTFRETRLTCCTIKVGFAAKSWTKLHTKTTWRCEGKVSWFLRWRRLRLDLTSSKPYVSSEEHNKAEGISQPTCVRSLDHLLALAAEILQPTCAAAPRGNVQ